MQVGQPTPCDVELLDSSTEAAKKTSQRTTTITTTIAMRPIRPCSRQYVVALVIRDRCRRQRIR